MDFIVISIIISVFVVFLAILYFKFIGSSVPDKKVKAIKNKDRDTIIKEANKKLSSNPKDAEALQALANLAFTEGEFDKALKTYRILISLVDGNEGMDEFTINLRYGISCFKVNQIEEAYKSLVIAKAMNAESFELQFYLGMIEYQRKVYEKALAFLQTAYRLKPEYPGILKYLGQSLFKMKKSKEAINFLKKAVDVDPTDKETLYYLAECYFDGGQADNALKIFSHLRPDPQLGPKSSLFAATINYNARQYDKAIGDLELGLRHTNISRDILLEMKYRLAAAYNQNQDMDSALRLLKEIRSVDDNYKDVPAQIARLSEFSSNRNLQTYMVSPASEFVILCRNLCFSFFPKAKIKIVDVNVQKNDYADILCEVSTSKWEDIILFRFLRTNAQVGELFLREMHQRIKEVRAGRGFCITAGTYTQTAKQFVEARLIDLVEKDGLLKAMSNLK